MFQSTPNIEKMITKNDRKGLIKALAYRKKDYYKDAEIRQKAAEALGKMEDPSTVEPLIIALEDSNSFVRKYSAEALGAIKDLRAAESLINALSDRDESVCNAAAKALGEIGDPQAVEQLIKALVNETQYIRSSAAKALGNLNDSRAVEPLIKILADVYEYARSDAAEALGKLKDLRAVIPLTKTLSDKSKTVRAAAVQALGELKDPRAIEPLIKVLVDSDANIRRKATIVLYKLGETKWKDLVQGENRYIDIGKISELKDLRFVEPLIQILEDKDEFSCKYAAEALGKLKDPRAVEPLIQTLKLKEGDVRLAAAIALGELKDPRAIEPIVEVLGAYGNVPKAYEKALAELKDLQSKEYFIKVLFNKNATLRKIVAAILEELGETQWKELITGDSEDLFRLVGLHDIHFAEQFIKALWDSDEYFRNAARTGLSEMKDPRLIQPLIKALTDIYGRDIQGKSNRFINLHEMEAFLNMKRASKSKEIASEIAGLEAMLCSSMADTWAEDAQIEYSISLRKSELDRLNFLHRILSERINESSGGL